jgi:hypothetical protein
MSGQYGIGMSNMTGWRQVFLVHQGDLKDDGVVEFPQIEAGIFLIFSRRRPGVCGERTASGRFRIRSVCFKEALDVYCVS